MKSNNRSTTACRLTTTHAWFLYDMLYGLLSVLAGKFSDITELFIDASCASSIVNQPPPTCWKRLTRSPQHRGRRHRFADAAEPPEDLLKKYVIWDVQLTKEFQVNA